MKYAIVENGVVVNVAIADTPIGKNWIKSDEAGIGWLYENGVFTDPNAPPVMNLGGGGGPIEPG